MTLKLLRRGWRLQQDDITGLSVKDWTTDSWRAFDARQQPVYTDAEQFASILDAIKGYPPLVSPGECRKLQAQIAEAGRGERFILQGGDCAERFIDCNERMITNKIKILLQMSVILTHGIRRPVVRIGRIAGQFAKPRSRDKENVDGKLLPSYRGDGVNDYSADEAGRIADPTRLLQAYYHSSITLNHIRAKIDGGFADLRHPFHWNLHAIEQSPKWPEYQEILERVLEAIHFMEIFGGVNQESLGKIDFFTSHEGLLLGYEEALTRKDPESGDFYNLGAHMLWIGDRTRSLDGAHVEYFRGIANPIGIKLGPSCSPDQLLALVHRLNPENQPGRITLISRFGCKQVQKLLPDCIRAVREDGLHVTWSCDPMHGNIISTDAGHKTRQFSDILDELLDSFRIHAEMESYLAGAHFELTGEDVTECVGGAVELTQDDLHRNYATYCDPRLNYAQSLEMAFAITGHFRRLQQAEK